MTLAEEERCATCGSGDPRKLIRGGEHCGDPYHASAWDDDEQPEWRRVHRGELTRDAIEEVIRAHDPGEAAEIIYWRAFRAITRAVR